MLIDMHVHAFPDAIAERTVTKLAETCGQTPLTHGTLAQTRAYMDAQGVDMAVLQPVATRPGQKSLNTWAAAACDARILSFGSVHPDDTDVRERLAAFRGLGLRGVKLHPDYQGFDLLEPRLGAFYEALEEAGLPVLFHAGVDPISPKHVHAPARDFATLAQAFPGMTIIAAHVGGYAQWEDVRDMLAGCAANLYIDTALAGHCQEDALLLDIFRRQGLRRVLFGSDCPWGAPSETLTRLNRLGLSADEMRDICERNFRRVVLGEA